MVSIAARKVRIIIMIIIIIIMCICIAPYLRNYNYVQGRIDMTI